MGKLKQMLIDTDQEDQTDPRDPGVYPGQEEAEAEAEVSLGWAVFDLIKAANYLHEHAYSLTVGDLQDISKATLKLQDIPTKVNKPF